MKLEMQLIHLTNTEANNTTDFALYPCAHEAGTAVSAATVPDFQSLILSVPS